MTPHIHVLLVEDDPLTAFNIKRALRRCAEVTEITVAVDGRDAIDQLRSGALDPEGLVVLTDLSMPRMSGLELATAIRAEPGLRHLAIVVLTSSTDDADRDAAAALHVAGYFVKSADTAYLDEVRACVCT